MMSEGEDAARSVGDDGHDITTWSRSNRGVWRRPGKADYHFSRLALCLQHTNTFTPAKNGRYSNVVSRVFRGSTQDSDIEEPPSRLDHQGCTVDITRVRSKGSTCRYGVPAEDETIAGHNAGENKPTCRPPAQNARGEPQTP